MSFPASILAVTALALCACATGGASQEISFDSESDGLLPVGDIVQMIEGVEDPSFAANCKDVLVRAVKSTNYDGEGFYFNKPRLERAQMAEDFTIGWRVWEKYFEDNASAKQKSEWVKRKRIDGAKTILLGSLADMRPLSVKGDAFSAEIDECYKPVAKARMSVANAEEMNNG